MQNNLLRFLIKIRTALLLPILLLLFMAVSLTGHGQTPVTIWSEDFNDEADYAQTGTGTPFSLGVTWTSDGNLKVLNDRLQTTGTISGPDNWSTTRIPISGYSNVTIKMDVGEIGDMENSDQVHVSYTVDLLTPVQIDNFNDDFEFIGVVTGGITGTDLFLDVSIKNDAPETHYIDNVAIIGTPAVSAVCKTFTAQLGSNGQVTIAANDVDGGSTLGASLSVEPNVFSCDDLGANTVVLTATYGGVSASCEAVVTVEDKLAPTLTGTIPSGAINQNICLSAAPLGPTEEEIAALFADNCSNVIVTKSGNFDEEDTDCNWDVTYHFVITDDHGNEASPIDITYSGGDKTAPALTGSWPSNNTGVDACLADAPAGPSNETIQALYTDDCGGVVTVSQSVTPEADNDNCAWSFVYEYTIQDECGNVVMPKPTVTVSGGDKTAPALTGSWPSNNTGVDACLADAPAGPSNETIQALYTDGCGGVVSVTQAVTPGTANDNCVWSFVYEYTIQDECGNVVMPKPTVTVSGGDKTAPALTGSWPSNNTGVDACLADAPAGPSNETIQALYTDGCGGVVSVTQAVTPGTANDNCVWSFVYEYTIQDECGNVVMPKPTVTVSGGDKTAPTVVTKDITVTLNSDGTVTIADNAVDDGSFDNCGGEVTFSLSQASFTCDDIGENELTLTVYDACLNESTGSATVTVNVPTVTVAKISAEKARYMDEVTLYAEIESYCGIGDLEGTIEFFLDDTSIGSATAWPIPAGEEGNPDKLRATMIYKFINLPKDDYENDPWLITAKFTPATAYYEESTSNTTNLFIYPREATPFNAVTGFYTGEILAWTTGPNSSTGTITMAATIKDNTPGGDVRGAVVTFCYYNGSTLTPIPSAKNIPVGLINMTDGSIGIASADVQIDIAKATSQDYQIAVVVSGGYTNMPLSEDSYATVTVAKPVANGSIFGAGKLENDCSEGQIRGAVGEQTEFSYDVSYNKKMTNPQGRMTLWVKSWYNAQGILDGTLHTYIIKSNAINLFVTNQVASSSNTKLPVGQAVFEAKANLSELVGSTLVNIDGNSPLRVTMTDLNANVDDGSETIGITYFRSSGGLWFSSCLNKEIGLATDESVIVVKTTTGLKSAEINGEVATPVAFEPSLKVFPNPFTERLNIEFSYETDTKAKLEIFSVTGARLETLYDGPVSGGQLYNFEYLPRLTGSQMVFYHLTLDGKTQVGKVLFNERR